MRSHLLLAVLSIVACVGLSNVSMADQNRMENVDLTGGDLPGQPTEVPKPNGGFLDEAGICEHRCGQDASCVAWTLVKANTIQGPVAKCWLKGVIPGQNGNNCCTSGVPYKEFSPGVDRTGGDLKPGFPIADANQCKAACEGDNNCQSWTFVNANVQGPQPMCWLKNQIPPARSDQCCTSGVASRAPVLH